MSHLRAQFSRDLQSSSANSSDPRTHITNVLDGIGRSTILPRETREHRLHLAETLSVEQGRNSWKFGGDMLRSWIYNFFPSMFGGEYYYDTMPVNPWTFEPMRYGLKLTPLRAYAHQVPRYHPELWLGGLSSRHQRVRRLRVRHPPRHRTPRAQPRRAL